MEIKHSLYSSLEDISEQVDIIEAFAESTDMSLEGNDTIADILDSLEHRAAFAKAEYSTKLRTRDERRDVINIDELRIRLLAATTINHARIRYEQNPDLYEVAKEVKDIFSESDHKVDELKYEKMLRGSELERKKQSLARHGKMRVVLPRALATAAGAVIGVAAAKALRDSGEWVRSLTPAAGGIAGAIAPAIIYNVRATSRWLSRHIGGVFRLWSQASFDQYQPPQTYLDEVGDPNSENKGLLCHYAKRDNETTTAFLGNQLLDYGARGRDDIAPMIREAAEDHRKRVLKDCGITVEKDSDAPWYRRLPTKLTGLDFLN